MQPGNEHDDASEDEESSEEDEDDEGAVDFTWYNDLYIFDTGFKAFFFLAIYMLSCSST